MKKFSHSATKLKRFNVLVLTFVFLLSQLVCGNTNVLSVHAAENVYSKDFNDGLAGSWTNLIGAGQLSVENNQLKIVRNSTNNKFVMVDNNSPDLLDAEAQCNFTLVGGTSRFGIILRGSSASSHLFIGYNDLGKWLIETSSAWKDDIAGPTPEAGQSYKLKVRVVGKKVSIWLDDTSIFDQEVTLDNFPTTAGKVGFRTWYDNKSILVDNLKYGAPGSIIDAPPAAKTIKSLTSVNLSTYKGVAPSLPSEVTAVYSDGSSGQEKVTWDSIDASKYNTLGSFQVQGTVSGTDLKAIADITVTESTFIESEKLKVSIDNAFPRISMYEYKSTGKILYGQEDEIKSVDINGTLYNPKITFSTPSPNQAIYSMVFDDIKVSMDAVLTAKDNVLNLDIKNIKENGDTLVNTIAIPNQNLISVRNIQKGAALAGAHMYTAVSGTGDTFLDLTNNTTVNNSPTGYMYAFLNTSELSAGLWTNAMDEDTSGVNAKDNGRILKMTVSKNSYYRTGLWSGRWTYRAKGMPIAEDLPSAKIVITDDKNNDNIVDWQDGAIAFRSIMNNPFGSEKIPDMVVQRIPFNFGSQATNPFLKVLDETKRIYLATDGLGQNVLLKGYGSEGHDSAHPDYGVIGQRQGGVNDMKTLVNEGSKYNAFFGVHINATESYPEAKAFNEQLVNKNSKGWDWLDSSYYIDTKYDASSGNRLARLNELKSQVPNLEFIYLDVWYNNGWSGRKIAKEINSMGWRLETEFPSVLEYDATWNHWAVDYKYGGASTKGFNSNIVQFIRNHQKDTWIAKDPLLGGTELSDYEGWQGRTNFDDMIKMTFNTDLPTKYLQHFPIIKWATNTINFEDNVSVSNSTGTRIITKDDREVLHENSYLLPWDPKEETKLYHWNKDGGTTTWKLPKSWNGLKDVKLYKLSDQGKTLIETLKVNDNKITINAESNVAYVVYKGAAAPQKAVSYGEGTHLKDPGFNSNSLNSWVVNGEGAAIERNDRGQYELKVGKGSGVSLSQQITGLSEGTYSASVYVQVEGKRRASISVKDSEGKESINYTDSSIAENFISGDSKHGTKMQVMRTLFDVPAGSTTATLTLKVEGGISTVTFDDLRIVKTERSTKPIGEYFYEDFEHIDMGLYPFVKGPAGGANDPRTHLAELHAPYTQKGWNGKAIDDVIDGSWSLKIHQESTGLLLQTIPQNLRFEIGKSYRVSFKYEAEKTGDYKFLIGDSSTILSSKPFSEATTPTVFTKEFKASNSGESWVGIQSITGNSDMVIDDFLVEEIPSAEAEPTEIVPVDLATIPREMIKATATSAETESEDNSASMAIDNNPGTIWHTKWDGSDKLPQSITLDLGANFNINKVTVLPRQSGDNGLIKQYSLLASTNGTDFIEIAKGTWDTSDKATKALMKTISFSKVQARYVRLTALDGVNGWASAAEINVYRDPVSIVSALSPTVKTIAGNAPKLPETVTARLSDDTETSLPVKWEAVQESNYSQSGSFKVNGFVNESEIKVTATVAVVVPKSVEAPIIETMKGKEPALPDAVNVVFDDGSKSPANVIWGAWGYIDPSIYASPGSYEINGKVEGIELSAKAIIKVIEKNTPIITVDGINDKDVVSNNVKPVITVTDDDSAVTTTITLNGEDYNNEEISKEGSYELKISAVDQSGNQSNKILIFTIDKTNPNINISGIKDKDAVSGKVKPEIAISDNNEIASSKITLNGNDYDGREINTIGSYELKIIAIDKAGNKMEKTVQFTIDNPALETPTPTPPSISSASSTNGNLPKTGSFFDYVSLWSIGILFVSTGTLLFIINRKRKLQ